MAKPLAKLLSMLKPKRRWAQFSLATMFIVVTVLCTWLAVQVNRAHRQRDAVAAIEAIGGAVGYKPVRSGPARSYPETFAQRFLRRWLSRDHVDDVLVVYLGATQVTDSGLEHLRGLRRLRDLWLTDTQVTDAGLAHLQGLQALEFLGLDGTQVTDAGLAHLHGLMRLQVLLLGGTQVTDAGLSHLQGLTELKELSLGGTLVTNASVANLQKALPKCRIKRRYVGRGRMPPLREPPTQP